MVVELNQRSIALRVERELTSRGDRCTKLDEWLKVPLKVLLPRRVRKDEGSTQEW